MNEPELHEILRQLLKFQQDCLVRLSLICVRHDAIDELYRMIIGKDIEHPGILVQIANIQKDLTILQKAYESSERLSLESRIERRHHYWIVIGSSIAGTFSIITIILSKWLGR